jgi:hypothetical protein
LSVVSDFFQAVIASEIFRAKRRKSNAAIQAQTIIATAIQNYIKLILDFLLDPVFQRDDNFALCVIPCLTRDPEKKIKLSNWIALRGFCAYA